MVRVRLVAYELLTQMIVSLGRLREAVAPPHLQYTVRGRVYDHFSIEVMVCCDCGLAHHIEHFPSGESCEHGQGSAVGHMWPQRLKGYGYRLRFGAGRSDLAEGS